MQFIIFARARACVERAVERNPRSYRAHRLRAAIAIDLGDFETAERSFALCEELEPEVTPEGLRTAEFKRRRFPAEFAAFLLDRDPVRFHWAKRYLLKH